jgi:outer membrane immunogenic protein
MLRCVSVLAFAAFSIAPTTATHAQIPQRWNGPYLGVNIGHGSADIGGTLTVLDQGGKALYGPAGYGIDADGMFGGVQVGFNRRIGNFFVGLEADLQTADISGSTRLGSKSFAYSASASMDWFGTARARAGFATDAVLVYATGGLAFGNVDLNATYKNSNGTAHLSSSDTRVGFVLGAGVEFALRPGWSLKLEYQYLDFGSRSAEDAFFWEYCNKIYGKTVSTDFDTDIHTVRIGLNYAFGAQPRHEPLKP